ncbi:hypothetical protein evm_010809 [Chilo suppressalis]|nr:hypothetical protein evm_010809 [Chilo suppressalis]
MSATDLRCINCDIRLRRLRRHVLTDVDDGLKAIIQHWTYPRNITENDCICHACWELANYQFLQGNSQAGTSQQVGHHNLCVNCRRSILRTSSRQVIRENANEEQAQMATVISTWIHPRQLTSADQACVPCWLRAQRAARRLQPLVTREDDGEDNNDISTSDTQTNCINCDAEITLEVGHHLSNEHENLKAIIKLWTFPRPINLNDWICSVCWEMARHQLQHTCIVCGVSTIENEYHIINYVSEEENQIATLINQRIQPRQVTSNEPICETCWEQAHENLQRNIEHQLRTQTITLPNVRRVSDSSRYCLFRGCNNIERNHVPDYIRRNVLKSNHFYIPRGSRVCNYHLEANNFNDLYTDENSLDFFNPKQLEDIIFILTEDQCELQFNNIQMLPEHWVQYFLGIKKEEHQVILNETRRLGSMRRGSLALTILLCKLRTGDSNERLSVLFQIPRRTLETLMDVAREILTQDFTTNHLGIGHIRREQIITKNSIIAEGLFGNPELPPEQKNAIVIADGTYIYTQKSSNYLFQKETYSLHKYRNLVKPLLIVCCDGYILDVFGPYAATTNDATIMNSILDNEALVQYFNENDVFILDRGFRDSMDKLHDKGFLAHMPESLSPGHSQFTTLEGNRTRCVTINRWVVEAVNGHIKRDFKLFRHEYFNRASKHLMKDLKIACSILNAFGTRFTNPNNANEILNIINNRLFIDNLLATIVSIEHLNRRNVLFTDIDVSTITFPRLPLEELVLFACGTYQIKQARSYVGEHFRLHGIYNLQIGREQVDLSSLGGENPFLIKAKIKSRHVGRKTYFVFIAVEREQHGRDAIIGYCCNCIVGLRTVGCCSHVMSVVWYLAYGRHEGVSAPAEFLDTVLLRVE